jgi:hypothetical protein
MSEEKKKCMTCGKPVTMVKGGICEPCQERIRREALGEQADKSKAADRELTRHGITPGKKQ